jgi:hypothetical protein
VYHWLPKQRPTITGQIHRPQATTDHETITSGKICNSKIHQTQKGYQETRHLIHCHVTGAPQESRRPVVAHHVGRPRPCPCTKEPTHHWSLEGKLDCSRQAVRPNFQVNPHPKRGRFRATTEIKPGVFHPCRPQSWAHISRSKFLLAPG